MRSLISTSSRSICSPRVMSSTLTTSMSFLSWLAICRMTASEPLVTSVRRETVGSSVDRKSVGLGKTGVQTCSLPIYVLDPDDVDELLELVGDLQDDRLRAAGHEREARNRRIVGGGHRQRLDVVAAAGKHAGPPRARGGLILREDIAHVSH